MRRTYLLNEVDLIGVEYLWRVIHGSSEEICSRAIELLKETFSNLGPNLNGEKAKQIHEDFIANCVKRLKTNEHNISCLSADEPKDSSAIDTESTRMCRVLRLLFEYISECDHEFGDIRASVPLLRAAKGRQIIVTLRCVHCRGNAARVLSLPDNFKTKQNRLKIDHRYSQVCALQGKCEGKDIYCSSDYTRL